MKKNSKKYINVKEKNLGMLEILLNELNERKEYFKIIATFYELLLLCQVLY